MDEGAGVSFAIVKMLKSHPRGLTVTDISRKLGYNRNSTAKHLGILTAEGKIEVRSIGTAKVYSLTQRVPLSAFLCFTKNMILILDTDLNVVQVNDQFLKLAGCTKEELLGGNLSDIALPVVTSPEALTVIRSSASEQVAIDIRSPMGNGEFFYRMDVIPTTFEAGEKGVTLVLEDITERKRYLKNMEFLARTAMELVDMPPDADIYHYVAETVAEILPHPPQCFVESYDEVNRQFFCRAILSLDFREKAAQIIGQDVVGMTFPISEYFFAAPFFETPSTFRPLREYRFRPYFEDEEYSMYEVCIRQIPKEICDRIVRELGIGRMYQIGLVWQEQLFGIVAVFMPPENELEDKEVLESFLRQASIAIARRQIEDRLRRSEGRLSEIVDLAPAPVAIIDPEGRYVHVNRLFTEMFGYTIQDIPNGKTWFIKAFPDPDRRKEAIAAWKADLVNMQSGQIGTRTFEVRCKSGERKMVGFNPVVLSDGTQYIGFEDCSVVG